MPSLPPTISHKPERRHRRAALITEALTFQLQACCDRSGVHAMVLADEDGLALARSGDCPACDEVAATMVQLGARTAAFSGTLLRNGQRWDVEMTRIVVDGSPLMVYAVGGSAEQRAQQIARGARGALRILGAA